MTRDDAARLDVVVVGAGLAGLTAAAFAAGDGARVVVLDGDDEETTDEGAHGIPFRV
jgi:flavin-dependent dehydrogenase